LNLAIAVAMGGKALNEYEIPRPGNVLYLALEDNKSRLKRRMGILMRQVIPWPNQLSFVIFSPRMGAGFTEALRAWLESHDNPSCVIVDMYTKISQRRKKKSNNSEYDDVYEELEPIRLLAEEFHICVLLVMHLNKNADAEDEASRIMGSTAYGGATVTNLILRRLSPGDAADGILKADGKDIEEPGDIALIFDGGIWLSRGDADIYNQSVQRLAILDFLYHASGNDTTPRDIAAAIDKNASTTRVLLKKLKEDGLVSSHPVDGTYHLTNAGAEVLRARAEDNDRARNLDKFEDDLDMGSDDGLPPWMNDFDPNF
jgi:DNA-binding transcriptional ArsR family regulator